MSERDILGIEKAIKLTLLKSYTTQTFYLYIS